MNAASKRYLINDKRVPLKTIENCQLSIIGIMWTALAGGGDVLLRMRHTHKMATNTSGNAGRALSFAI